MVHIRLRSGSLAVVLKVAHSRSLAERIRAVLGSHRLLRHASIGSGVRLDLGTP